MKTFCWIILFFAAPRVEAHTLNLEGVWLGEGFYRESTGFEVPCDLIRLEFVQTSESLKLLGGVYECAGMTSTLNPEKFEILENDRVRYRGAVCGVIVNNTFDMRFEDPAGHTQRLKMVLSEGRLVYLDQWIDIGRPGRVQETFAELKKLENSVSKGPQ